MVPVRVVDTRGQGVPNVEVEVFHQFLDAVGRRFRTGGDGQVQIPIDPEADLSYGTRFLRGPMARRSAGGIDPDRRRRRGRTRLRSRLSCFLELIKLKVQLWIRPTGQSVEFRSGYCLWGMRATRAFWITGLLRRSRFWDQRSQITSDGTP